MMAYSKQYKEETLNKVFDLIESGHSLLKASDKVKHKTKVLHQWIEELDKSNNYARAKETRAELIFEEILSISDNIETGTTIETDSNGKTTVKEGDMIAHRRLKVDSRKWMLGKMLPKKYGDRLELDNKHSGEIKTNLSELSTDELLARAAAKRVIENEK